MSRLDSRNRTGAKRDEVDLENGSRKRDWMFAGLLVLLVLIVFCRLFTADFVGWDDRDTVAHNPYLNPPSISALSWAWVHPHMNLYIPVTYTFWFLVATVSQVFGPTEGTRGGVLHPGLFHAANVCLHAANVMLVYRLARRLNLSATPAALGAAIFAIHPIQVESVAWVSGLKDLLCGLLSLVSIEQFLMFTDAGGRRRYVHFIAATAAFVLALLAKPAAVVVPALAFVLAVLGLGKSWRSMAMALSPWLLPAIACIAWTRGVQPAAMSARGVPLYLRPLIATDSAAFYLYKLVWPAALSIDYGRTPEQAVANHWVYYTWIAPAVLVIVVWWKRRSVPLLLVGTIFAFLAIAPVLGAMRFGFQFISTVTDHYAYLAMAGVAMAIAAVLRAAQLRWLTDRWNILLVASISAVITLATRSFFQTEHWQDSQTLFAHTLDMNHRSWVAHHGLSALAVEGGDVNSAVSHAEQAAHLQQEYAPIFATLGTALAMQGRLPESADAFEKAIALEPENAETHASLAGALAQQGKFQAADAEISRALELDPGNARAYVNLGTMLAQSGRIDESIVAFENAVRLAPRDLPQAHANLGFLLLQKGRIERATAEFRAALAIDPHFAAGLAGLEQLKRIEASK